MLSAVINLKKGIPKSHQIKFRYILPTPQNYVLKTSPYCLECNANGRTYLHLEDISSRRYRDVPMWTNT